MTSVRLERRVRLAGLPVSFEREPLRSSSRQLRTPTPSILKTAHQVKFGRIHKGSGAHPVIPGVELAELVHQRGRGPRSHPLQGQRSSRLDVVPVSIYECCLPLSSSCT